MNNAATGHGERLKTAERCSLAKSSLPDGLERGDNTAVRHKVNVAATACCATGATGAKPYARAELDKNAGDGSTDATLAALLPAHHFTEDLAKNLAGHLGKEPLKGLRHEQPKLPETRYAPGKDGLPKVLKGALDVPRKGSGRIFHFLLLR
jgi:hypothetical protein